MKQLSITTKVLVLVPTICFGVLVFAFFVYIPAENYPQIFIVEDGETVRSVGERLHSQGLAAGENIFVASVLVIGGTIHKGAYYLTEPKSTFQIARDLASGVNNLPNVEVLVRQRETLFEVVDLFSETFPHLQKEKILGLFLEHNGKIYPDTYYFPKFSIFSEEDVLRSILQNYESKTKDLFDIYNGELTEEEILILASIVDLEASKSEDRRKIAGVIYNRLEQDIPLQVDVSFYLINQKDSYSLSLEDLKIDHPLNTYTNKGLPPVPLTSPTLDSIKASLNPDKHDYIFFLSDRYNNTYFSETLKEHNAKKRKYL